MNTLGNQPLRLDYPTDQKVRPPLRWAGSKRRNIAKLLALAPRDTRHVIEPFVGSGCFTFGLSAQSSTISDLNHNLIDFYQDLSKSAEELYAVFHSIPVEKEQYYLVRNEYNSQAASIRRSANFLYLNRYGFNGIYRVNKAGKYNVPWGGERSGAPPSLEELIQVSEKLQKINITRGDFEGVVRSGMKPGTLVYLDPPYARDEKRVFREYFENSFVTSDWDRLVALLEDVDACGARFILSYAGDDELVRRLERWEVGKLDVIRNVGGFASSRRMHSEFVASNC